MTPDPLAGLRGYHLPEPLSWWPPAVGWWLLATAVVLVATLLLWLRHRRRRRNLPAIAAGRELAALRRAYDDDADGLAYVRGLSRLLRRAVLATFPDLRCAGLTGERWLAFLDANGGRGEFRQGLGRQLIDVPYRPAAPPASAPDPQALADLVARWLAANQRRRRS